jgi:hypothetical protein
MTHRTFADLMNETFLTGDVPDTTATTASAEPVPSLAPDTLMEVRRKLQEDYPVTYYIASENVEDKTAVYKVPSEYARCGYDLVCHPDMVPTLVAGTGGLLRPLDDAETDRRSAAMAARMAYRQAILDVNELLDSDMLSPLLTGARPPSISYCEP